MAAAPRRDGPIAHALPDPAMRPRQHPDPLAGRLVVGTAFPDRRPAPGGAVVGAAVRRRGTVGVSRPPHPGGPGRPGSVGAGAGVSSRRAAHLYLLPAG